MSKRKYLLLGLVLFVATWVGVELIVNGHSFLPSPPADVRIELTGSPDATIEATFEVDGVVSTVTRHLPTSFSYPHARDVKFVISREAGPGQLVAYVFINEAKWGPLGGPAEWLSGRIECGRMDSTCGQGPPYPNW